MAAVSGRLFFLAGSYRCNGHGGCAGLWKSDGTNAGTRFVKGLEEPYDLINIRGTLLFAAFDRVHGTELWKAVP